MADSQELISFIAQMTGEANLRVEENLGEGFVRLRVSEAERRQAKHDIQHVEDIVIELLRNARDAGARNGGFYLYAQTTGGSPMSVYPASATRADGSDAALHLGQNAEDLNADATIDRVGVSVFVGDGRLKVGASCNRADMWCVINGFTLEYQGMDDSNLLAYWNSQVAVARALDRDSLPQTVGAALDEAVDVDAESMGTEALTAALETLMATIEDAQGVMPPYKDYLRLADAAEEIAANSEPSMSALASLRGMLSRSASPNTEMP